MKPFAGILLVTFFFIFLLVTSYVSAEVDEVLSNPAGVDELVVQIRNHGNVIMDGNPTGININISIPQEDSRQDVDVSIDKITDVLSTVLGVVQQENPDNNFVYDVYSTVKSRANHLYSLPKSYVIPDDVEVYLQPTENIQSSNPRFKTLAEEITENSRDDFEKVAKLAFWIYDHLDYDLDYSEKNYDALTVLDTKMGVCAEYTTLFIALARSIGIPAKFVSGWSYGDRGWERHAYSEVYLGEWVPVDPLWLEIGYLDATHLRFGDHIGNKVQNKLEVTGFGVKSIDWAEDNITLEILSHSQIEKETEYEMSVSSQDFREGDDGVVILSVIPEEYIVGRVVLQTCSGDYDIVDVIDKEKRVILRPGEEQQIYWKIKISDDLPDNYIFTCPLTLNSRSLALKKVEVAVNTKYDERVSEKLSAKLSANVIELGEEQTVFISTVDMPSGSYVGVVADDNHRTYEGISGDFLTTFSFTPRRLGENEVIVYSSEGETISLKFNVETDLLLSIDDFRSPDYLKIGENENVSAYVVNNGLNEENVQINMRVDGDDNFANFAVKNKYFVSLPVSFSEPGLKTVKFTVSSSGITYSETKVIEVYEEPVIFYDTFYEDGEAVLKLDIKNSAIKDVNVKVGEAEKTLESIFSEDEIRFSLQPGKYPMTITCTDIAGKPYEVKATVEFKEMNFIEQIMSAINDFVEYLISLF